MKNIATIVLCSLVACGPALAQVPAQVAPPASPGRQGEKPKVEPSSIFIAYVPTHCADSVLTRCREEAGSSFQLVVGRALGSDSSNALAREMVTVEVFGSFADSPSLVAKLKEIAKQVVSECDPVRTALLETIDVDFKGGTAEEFISTVFPKDLPLNVVYPGNETRTMTLPALAARQLSRQSLLELMRSISGQSGGSACVFEWLNPNGKESDRPTVIVRHSGGVPTQRSGEARQAIEIANRDPAVLRISPADATSDAARADQERAQKQVMSAIDDGIQLRGGASEYFKVKLNPATGVLFVQGNYKEKELVAAVVKAMTPQRATPADADVAPPSAAPRPANPADPVQPSQPRARTPRPATPPPTDG